MPDNLSDDEKICGLCGTGKNGELEDGVFHTIEIAFGPASTEMARVYCPDWVAKLEKQAARVGEIIRSQGRPQGHKLGLALSNMERTIREKVKP